MKHSGYSLIELIIVMAIIAILAAIALPFYSLHAAKENIKQAQADLELLSLRLESRYQRVLAHPTSDHDTTASLMSVVSNWSPISDPNDFSFSSENASTTSYTIKATGQTGLVKDCLLKLSEDGNRTISNCEKVTYDGSWL